MVRHVRILIRRILGVPIAKPAVIDNEALNGPIRLYFQYQRLTRSN